MSVSSSTIRMWGIGQPPQSVLKIIPHPGPQENTFASKNFSCCHKIFPALLPIFPQRDVLPCLLFPALLHHRRCNRILRERRLPHGVPERGAVKRNYEKKKENFCVCQSDIKMRGGSSAPHSDDSRMSSFFPLRRKNVLCYLLLIGLSQSQKLASILNLSFIFLNNANNLGIHRRFWPVL